jgi:predicted transcriptional regulator
LQEPIKNEIEEIQKMADISVTASSVVPANANTGIARGTAGATITAGQAIYLDPADGKLKPALSSDQTQSGNVVGIALNGASSGQPVAYAFSGDVTFNAVLTAATVFVLGSAAGGISASADLDSSSNTRYGVVLGIATSTTNLRMGVIISGVKNP